MKFLRHKINYFVTRYTSEILRRIYERPLGFMIYLFVGENGVQSTVTRPDQQVCDCEVHEYLVCTTLQAKIKCLSSTIKLVASNLYRTRIKDWRQYYFFTLANMVICMHDYGISLFSI